jgi:hypothetical protein
MRTILTLHPDGRCAAVSAIKAEAQRREAGVLSLRYLVTGAMEGLVLPPPAAATRTDELWRHSCFEAFVGTPDVAGYAEVNLAPSGQWAAYRFDGYRQGMAPLEPFAPPAIATKVTDRGLELSARLRLDEIAGRPWRLGLSAVIEEVGGQVSYWAVAHPAGRPDFHHRDGFALDLPWTGRP